MRALVCGSRSWNTAKHGDIIYAALDGMVPDLPENEIIQGCAPGADEWAMQWATDHEVKCIFCPAEWDIYGKRAGILRNLRMLDMKPDLVIAFWDGSSRGTKHTIEEAQKRGIPVRIVQ